MFERRFNLKFKNVATSTKLRWSQKQLWGQPKKHAVTEGNPQLLQ
jgi:hypothetical protein